MEGNGSHHLHRCFHQGTRALWLKQPTLKDFMAASRAVGQLTGNRGRLEEAASGLRVSQQSPDPQEGKEQQRPLLQSLLLLPQDPVSVCGSRSLLVAPGLLRSPVQQSQETCLVKEGLEIHPCCSAHGYHLSGRNKDNQRSRWVSMSYKKTSGTRIAIAVFPAPHQPVHRS